MGKYVDISKFAIDAVKGSSIEFDAGILYALKKLEEQPTVDAVEVVRCKDCKYYRLRNVSPRYKPSVKYCVRSVAQKFAENGFCSYGERGTNEQIC